MPLCDTCGQKFRGFGTTCANCRRGTKTKVVSQQCQICGSFFSGAGNRCTDCGKPDANRCHLCGKTAYPMERIAVDGRNIHLACFKCTVCGRGLSLSKFSLVQGSLYCEVHDDPMFQQQTKVAEQFQATAAPDVIGVPDAVGESDASTAATFHDNRMPFQAELHLEGHRAAIISVAVFPNGRMAITGSADHKAIIWDTGTGEQICVFSSHTAEINSVAVFPNCDRVVTGSGDAKAIVSNVNTLQEMLMVEGHSAAIFSLAVFPGGDKVITGGRDKKAIIWNADSGENLHELEGHTGTIGAVAVFPAGDKVITGSDDNEGIIWDATTGKKLHALAGHRDYVSSVAVFPLGNRVITGSRDKSAIIWDANTGSKIHELRHTRVIGSVAIFPGGDRVITGSWDKKAVIWCANTGEKLEVLAGHDGDVNSVAVFPTTHKIITGADDIAIIWKPTNLQQNGAQNCAQSGMQAYKSLVQELESHTSSRRKKLDTNTQADLKLPAGGARTSLVSHGAKECSPSGESPSGRKHSQRTRGSGASSLFRRTASDIPCVVTSSSAAEASRRIDPAIGALMARATSDIPRKSVTTPPGGAQRTRTAEAGPDFEVPSCERSPVIQVSRVDTECTLGSDNSAAVNFEAAAVEETPMSKASTQASVRAVSRGISRGEISARRELSAPVGSEQVALESSDVISRHEISGAQMALKTGGRSGSHASMNSSREEAALQASGRGRSAHPVSQASAAQAQTQELEKVGARRSASDDCKPMRTRRGKTKEKKTATWKGRRCASVEASPAQNGWDTIQENGVVRSRRSVETEPIQSSAS